MKTIDARGYECPMPVIMAKRAIKEGEVELSVLVDNEIATENLSKMAKQTGFVATVTKKADDDYVVDFKKDENAKIEKAEDDEYIVVINSNQMGTGEENFSKKLLENFTVALTEQNNLPKYVVCYNLGVELTSINENTIEDFKKLELGGTQILSCGLCLGNYNLKEKLQVGEITNMYRICELMNTYRVVKP